MSNSKRNHRNKKSSKHRGEYQPLDTKALMKELKSERKSKQTYNNKWR